MNATLDAFAFAVSNEHEVAFRGLTDQMRGQAPQRRPARGSEPAGGRLLANQRPAYHYGRTGTCVSSPLGRWKHSTHVYP